MLIKNKYNIIYNQCVGIGTAFIEGRLDDNIKKIRPRAWSKPEYGFDNLTESFITLFKVASLKWLSVLQTATSVTAVNMQPEPGISRVNVVYFIVFIVVGAYFCENLVVAGETQIYECLYVLTLLLTPGTRFW